MVVKSLLLVFLYTDLEAVFLHKMTKHAVGRMTQHITNDCFLETNEQQQKNLSKTPKVFIVAQ